MDKEQSEPKIGAGHASAMFRQGLSELRGMLYPESNVAQHAQYGLYGTRTPGEVMQERGALGRDLDEQPPGTEDPSSLDGPVQDLGSPGQDEPELERE